MKDRPILFGGPMVPPYEYRLEKCHASRWGYVVANALVHELRDAGPSWGGRCNVMARRAWPTVGVRGWRAPSGRRSACHVGDQDYFGLCVDRLTAEEQGSDLRARRAGQVGLFAGNT